ncbi:MAG: hypothetical protein AAFO91_07085, partial [Bacteroidota bacterium]
VSSPNMKYTSSGSLISFAYKYVRAFGESAVVGTIELTTERHQLLSWQILTDSEAIDLTRQGLLIYNE